MTTVFTINGKQHSQEELDVIFKACKALQDNDEVRYAIGRALEICDKVLPDFSKKIRYYTLNNNDVVETCLKKLSGWRKEQEQFLEENNKDLASFIAPVLFAIACAKDYKALI